MNRLAFRGVRNGLLERRSGRRNSRPREARDRLRTVVVEEGLLLCQEIRRVNRSLTTVVAGKYQVMSGDSSMDSPSSNDVGQVDDFSRDVSPRRSPDSFSVKPEGDRSNDLSPVNTSEIKSPSVRIQYQNLEEGPLSRRPRGMTAGRASVRAFVFLM